MSNYKKAGPLVQSEHGQRINQYLYTTMTASAAQLRYTSMPDRCATTAQGAVQLRLFALDGALSEPYVSARVGNGAAMSAAAGEGMRV